MALATIWKVPPAGPPPNTMRLPRGAVAGRETANASSAVLTIRKTRQPMFMVLPNILAGPPDSKHGGRTPGTL